MEKEYDAFISHASEDKLDFVRPLANFLQNLGASIWYDEFTLKVGQSLSRSIDTGLSKSRYGIVVLSKKFFNKNWTEYELRSLNALELENYGLILPVWLNVERNDVLKFSPHIADKLAVLTDGRSVQDVGLDLLDVIRPDLAANYHLRAKWNEISNRGRLVMEKVSELKKSPIRHENLPEDLVRRTKLIRAALLTAYPHSMDFWLDGFKRDANPEDEIAIWEKIATAFLERTQSFNLSAKQKKSVIASLVRKSCYSPDGRVMMVRKLDTNWEE